MTQDQRRRATNQAIQELDQQTSGDGAAGREVVTAQEDASSDHVSEQAEG